MNQLAPGAILAQISPSGTTAVTAISGLGVNFEVHFVTIQVDQNTNCTIYHDDDGTTYGLTTQIWYQARTVALNSDSMYSDSFPLHLRCQGRRYWCTDQRRRCGYVYVLRCYGAG